jgi:hypothetical protein
LLLFLGFLALDFSFMPAAEAVHERLAIGVSILLVSGVCCFGAVFEIMASFGMPKKTLPICGK